MEVSNSMVVSDPWIRVLGCVFVCVCVSGVFMPRIVPGPQCVQRQGSPRHGCVGLEHIQFSITCPVTTFVGILQNRSE